ncbi:DUF4908 domain-containing protein [Maricaulis sp. D1M11]|uniref:DUF4908 domain-containing protein n=1 Tax=Maricaulis sp. D1M11 TaxID=3076117 RepID=UPI0039B41B07
MIRILAAILALILTAGTALAVQNPLRDRLLRNERSEQSIGWYQRADNGAFILFDQSSSYALLRERDDTNAEILVLFPNRAPGGGMSFVTDTGRELVRFTSLGGATYFPSDAPNGVIIEFASPAGGLVPAPRSSLEVRARAERLAERASAVSGNAVTIEYAPAPRAGLGLQYDVLWVIERSLDGSRRSGLRQLERIQIINGERANAYRTRDSLIVVINPQAGYAGRPSSEFVRAALQAAPIDA